MYELKQCVKIFKNRKIFMNKGCENRNGDVTPMMQQYLKNKIRI